MTTQPHGLARPIAGSRRAFLSCLTGFGLTLGMAGTYADTADGANSAAILQGDWQVTQVLKTDRQSSPGAYQEDDAQLMGKLLNVQEDKLQFGSTSHSCTLNPIPGPKTHSMRTLFAKSAPGTRRPSGLVGSLVGRMDDYALGALKGQPVRLFQVVCNNAGRPLLPEANWVALTNLTPLAAPALLMPLQPGTLLVLRRPSQTQALR